MDANITTTVIEVVAGVAEVGLTGLLILLFTWIKKNTKSVNVKSAIDLLEQAATDTVGELQQTLVNGWKEVNEDGKLTDAEVDMLKLRSLSMVKSRIGPAAQEVISAAGIGLEDRINAAVQAAITAQKNASVVVVSEAALANME